MSSLVVSDAIKMLLSAVVDYAGFFPPAQLDLQTAMATYVRHQANHQGMLGRFVLPAARLREFTDLVPRFDFQSWLLNVVISSQIEVAIEQICSFQHSSMMVMAVEFPVFSLGQINQIDRLCQVLPTEIEQFFEVPLNEQLAVYLTALQSAKVFAKIRTGGITPDAFPSIHQLSQFLLACAQFQIPFKATAGLHHPLRGEYRMTYEAASPVATMHGFLNVAIAAALVYWQKITPDELQVLLGERKREAFQFEADQLLWYNNRQKYSLSLAEIQMVRQSFFRSFGSCSFQEPMDELAALNLL